jgi:hypothetical protein
MSDISMNTLSSCKVAQEILDPCNGKDDYCLLHHSLGKLRMDPEEFPTIHSFLEPLMVFVHHLPLRILVLNFVQPLLECFMVKYHIRY